MKPVKLFSHLISFWRGRGEESKPATYFQSSSSSCSKKIKHLYLPSSVVDPWHFGMDQSPVSRIPVTDLRIRIRLFSSVAFKMPTKISFFLSFFAYYFLKVHLHQSPKIKKSNSRSQGFSYFFLRDNKRGDPDPGGPRTYGSGSWSTTLLPSSVRYYSRVSTYEDWRYYYQQKNRILLLFWYFPKV
jgi:hypothetical protein